MDAKSLVIRIEADGRPLFVLELDGAKVDIPADAHATFPGYAICRRAVEGGRHVLRMIEGAESTDFVMLRAEDGLPFMFIDRMSAVRCLPDENDE